MPPGSQQVGVVQSLHRYPLKAAAGEHLSQVLVQPEGLEHDRRWALTSPDGTALSARQVPAVADLVARVAADELVVDGDLVAVVAAAGGPVEVRDLPGAHQQVAAVHLVSAGAESASDAPDGCGPDPRANLVLRLDDPGAERGWVGRDVAVGGAGGPVLRVTRTPSRCLGVYAEVVRAGTVGLGDAVVLLPAAGAEGGPVRR